VIEFYQTRTETKMTIAAERLAVIAAVTLPIPLAKLPSATVATGNVATGAKVFSANCESCHGAGGKNGTVGPSLAGIGIKPGQVAYMVQNPAGVDKDSGMPKLPLSATDVANVAAYVASLK
jgi:mono/diheme cytochrome c family protein